MAHQKQHSETTEESTPRAGGFVGRIRHAWRLLSNAVSGPSDWRQAFESELAVIRAEVDHLDTDTDTTRESTTYPGWGASARVHLDAAEQALARNDPVSFWRRIYAVKRLELYGLAPDILRQRAGRIEREAIAVLDSWREEIVTDLLHPADADEDPSVEEIYEASRILHEHYLARQRKTVVLQRELRYFMLNAFISVVAILLVTIAADLFIQESVGLLGVGAIKPVLLVVVALFGVMGASVSGILSLSNQLIDAQQPEQAIDFWLVGARVTLGAAAALAVFVFLHAGILEFDTSRTGLVLAVSFVAGFSERLLLRAVESVVGASTASQSRRSRMDK